MRAVEQVDGVDGILREVCSQPDLGDNRPLEIVVAINAHRIRVHGPAINNAGKGSDLPRHQDLSVVTRVVQFGIETTIGSFVRSSYPDE
jgi:hypothetical protein